MLIVFCNPLNLFGLGYLIWPAPLTSVFSFPFFPPPKIAWALHRCYWICKKIHIFHYIGIPHIIHTGIWFLFPGYWAEYSSKSAIWKTTSFLINSWTSSNYALFLFFKSTVANFSTKLNLKNWFFFFPEVTSHPKGKTKDKKNEKISLLPQWPTDLL